ncbi:hypothetical protein ABZ806_44605, partial [Spirillospora sp. NPDC047418]
HLGLQPVTLVADAAEFSAGEPVRGAPPDHQTSQFSRVEAVVGPIPGRAERILPEFPSEGSEDRQRACAYSIAVSELYGSRGVS